MTLPRSALVSLDATPYYHCIGRCVRRAFLCGHDRYSGRSFEHRRGWIIAKLAELASVFAIEVAAYAVMPNHYHVILKLNPDQAASWSVPEVLERWCRLFAGHPLVQQYLTNPDAPAAAPAQVTALAARYRARLADLSWFMRCLNESIARMANEEDGCTGRFWEGRFKSQALLDEAALLACMAYVDLNPVRAGLANTPEASDYTSIQQRLRAHAHEPAAAKPQKPERLAALMPRLMGFAGQRDSDIGLPGTLEDYLELVDWSGRAIHQHKPGRIADQQPKLVQRLQMEPKALVRYLSCKDHRSHGFRHVVGRKATIRAAAASLGRKFLQGITAAERLFLQRI